MFFCFTFQAISYNCFPVAGSKQWPPCVKSYSAQTLPFMKYDSITPAIIDCGCCVADSCVLIIQAWCWIYLNNPLCFTASLPNQLVPNHKVLWRREWYSPFGFLWLDLVVLDSAFYWSPAQICTVINSQRKTDLAGTVRLGITWEWGVWCFAPQVKG